MRQKEPSTPCVRVRAAARLTVIAFLLLGVSAMPALADGFRSFTTVTADYYFTAAGAPANYYVETDEVFLARIIPMLTLEARVTRDDFPGGPQHLFFLGPVVNFTDTTYMVAVYGLGIDAQYNAIHEFDATFNWETDTSALFGGAKGDYFASSGSWYVLPSIGGKFHLLPALGFFGEFFMSFDSNRLITGSFWGEADYDLTPVVDLIAGFTTSFSRDLGYSLIAGADFSITEDIKLKFKLSFLSNVVEYETTPQPTVNNGIESLLSLDWRF